MGCSDSDRQRINAGCLHKFNGIIRVRIDDHIRACFRFRICGSDRSKLAFYRYVYCMSRLCHFLASFDILFERKAGAIDHNGCESCLNGGHHLLEGCAVIQMNANRNRCLVCFLNDGFYHVCTNMA